MDDYAFYEISSLRILFIPSRNVRYGSYIVSGDMTEAIVYIGGDSCTIPYKEISVVCNVKSFSENTDYKYAISNNDKIILIKYLGESLILDVGDDFDLGVEKICSFAFVNAPQIETLIIPETVNTIEQSALFGLENLKKLVVPFIGNTRNATGEKGVLGYIFGEESFNNTARTQQMVGDYSYSYYYIPISLEEVIITDTEPLHFGAFYNCTNIKNLFLADNITTIESYALWECGIDYIWIPSSVSVMEYRATNTIIISSLSQIPDGWVYESYDSDNVLLENQGVSYNNNFVYVISNSNEATIIKYIGTAQDIDIPDFINSYPVTGLVNRLFYRNNIITSISISQYVRVIPIQAFSDADNLTSVIFREGSQLETIERHAFASSDKLTNINFPSSLKYIEDYAFIDTKLVNILLPEGLLYIGSGAFNCSFTLEKIFISLSVEFIGEDAINGIDGAIIYCEVPTSSEYWSDTWNSNELTVYWDYSYEDYLSLLS